MKKFITFTAIFFVTIGILFAESGYSNEYVDTDILIHAGLAKENTKIKALNGSFSAKEVMLGAEAWGLLKPNSLIGYGISLGAGCGIGPDKNVNFNEPSIPVFKDENSGASFSYYLEIGPAIAFYFGNFLRVAGNFCYTYGYKNDGYFKNENANFKMNIDTEYGGFSTGVQLKFFPNWKLNPLVGYKYTRGFSGNINIKTADLNSDNEKAVRHGYRYQFSRNLFYAGFALKL